MTRRAEIRPPSYLGITQQKFVHIPPLHPKSFGTPVQLLATREEEKPQFKDDEISLDYGISPDLDGGPAEQRS